jgi:hypothetical protein
MLDVKVGTLDQGFPIAKSSPRKEREDVRNKDVLSRWPEPMSQRWASLIGSVATPFVK